MARNPEHIIAVYMVANRRNGTIYTGVTSNLSRRIYEHGEGLIPGFTLKYGCKTLVWYERFELVTNAIGREKRIKKYPRVSSILSKPPTRTGSTSTTC